MSKNGNRYFIKRSVSGWKVHDTEKPRLGIPNVYAAVGKAFFRQADAQAEADRFNANPEQEES
jgi:hypothetical protein